MCTRTSGRLASPARLTLPGSLPGPFSVAAWRGSGYHPCSGHCWCSHRPQGGPSTGQRLWWPGFIRAARCSKGLTAMHSLCTFSPSLSCTWAQSPRTQGLLDNGAHAEPLPPGRRTYKARSKDPRDRVCDPAAGKGSRTQRAALTLGTSQLSHGRADPLASRQLQMWVRARGGQRVGAVSPAPTTAWLRAGSPPPPPLHPPAQQHHHSQGAGCRALHVPGCIQGSSNA